MAETQQMQPTVVLAQPGAPQAQVAYYPQPMAMQAQMQMQPGFQMAAPTVMQVPGAYQQVQAAGPVRYMPVPTEAPPSGCPPGLEYLAQVDQLLVQQQVEMLEILTGYETNNRYLVKNSLGQVVFHAVEENDAFTLNCGPSRPFQMKIIDNYGREIMRLDRPFRCSCCCCPCQMQTLRVYAPPDNKIGEVKQKCACCEANFDICDANDQPALKIVGKCTCSREADYNVFSLDGQTKIGCIRKQWTGLAQEMFSDADNFGVTFPRDMEVKLKATLFAATFLIDFMFYEDNNDHSAGHGHRQH